MTGVNVTRQTGRTSCRLRVHYIHVAVTTIAHLHEHSIDTSTGHSIQPTVHFIHKMFIQFLFRILNELNSSYSLFLKQFST